MFSLSTVSHEVKPNTSTLLELDKYELFIVSFSGGKDSLACVLRLLDMGVPKEKIELWHQDVDGHSDKPFMDWPVTAAYCRAVALALGLRLRFQWKVGGFLGEMLRKDSLTQGKAFEARDGRVITIPSGRGKKTTRELFPQKSSDLSVRWCSAYLKIDVASGAIANDPALKTTRKICYVSGERRQESTARSHYAELEKHRTSGQKRRVDHWRLVIDMSEKQVWELIQRHGIVPHPAYYLGWGRVSCLACIFGDADQWASVRLIAPETFARIASYEAKFGKTITKGKSVGQMADKGKPYAACHDAELVKLAMGTGYDVPVLVSPDQWRLPSGAYSHCGGPT